MEVQHHPQVGKKKFKEYFFEYLMIVLAVTTGFFAERLREYFSDHAKEKEYIQFLIEDLRLDKTNLSRSITYLDAKISGLDSLILLLNKPTNTEAEINDMYFFARWTTRKSNFYSSDRTMTGLKNSGAFRLLTDQELTESVIDYDQLVDEYKLNASNDVTERTLIYPFIAKIFDGNVFQSMVENVNGDISRPTGKNPLKTRDKRTNQPVHLLCSSIEIIFYY